MAATSTTRGSCEAWVSRIAALAANKPRAVVSGGAGFIGSHLCEALLARDTRGLALDNFITRSPPNLRHLPGHPDFEFRPAGGKHRGFIGGRVRLLLGLATPPFTPPDAAHPLL